MKLWFTIKNYVNIPNNRLFWTDVAIEVWFTLGKAMVLWKKTMVLYRKLIFWSTMEKNNGNIPKTMEVFERI